MEARIGYRCAAPGSTLVWRETEDPSRRFTHGPGVYFTSDQAYAERYCTNTSVRHKVEIVGLLLPSSSLVIKHPDYIDPAPEVQRLAELPEYQQLLRRLGRTPRWNVATALAELVDELGPDRFLAAMRSIGVVGTVGRSGHLPEEFAVFDERAIRKMGAEGLGKTPWVDRSMKTVWQRIVDASPKPEWVPRLEPGRKFSLTEYGCGHYGCVFPTSDPEVVAKLTSDPTEAFFVAAAMSIGTFPEGIVRYYGIYRIPGAMHRGRPLFVLWREEATKVGEALRSPYSGGVVKFLPEEDRARAQYDVRSREKAAKSLSVFKDYAGAVRDTLKRAADPFAMVEESKRYNDWAWRYVSEAEGVGRPLVLDRFKGAQKVALVLTYLERIAVEMENEYLADQIGGALKFYLDEGLLLADVHTGNIGLVEGRVGSSPIITDPGHAVPLDRKWANVQVEELP